ncbi:MAG: hypothetical protein PHQ27_06590 [Victivallales bacterium]|nr:hypothetical protein [Victivallales bacterium]
MKRVLVLLLFCGLAAWCPAAESAAPKPASPPASTAARPATPPAQVITGAHHQWDFLTIGFWFDVPRSTSYMDTYGLKVGAPFCSGRGMVKGLETAVFCGATDHINGMQACILAAKSEQVDGMQFSIVNYATSISGLQLGVVNLAAKKSFQIGIVNYIEDAPIPFLPICNFKF